MSYEAFKARVNEIINRSDNIKVWFSTENGKHYANCSDGTTIIGSESRLNITARWNNMDYQNVHEG